MKVDTIDKINFLVLNYLSIIGLATDEVLTETNPVSSYFYKNIYKLKISKPLNNTFDYENFKISYVEFINIISESYRIYNRLDNIVQNQNKLFKKTLIDMIGSEEEYNFYINNIVSQYRSALFDLVKDYNSKSVKFNEIKIKLLEEKMIYYGSIEEYDKAIELQNIIKKLKIKKED